MTGGGVDSVTSAVQHTAMDSGRTAVSFAFFSPQFSSPSPSHHLHHASTSIFGPRQLKLATFFVGLVFQPDLFLALVLLSGCTS